MSEEKSAILNDFRKDLEDNRILEMSTKDDEESVGKVKIEACELLLQHRVEQKFRTKKVNKPCSRVVDRNITNIVGLDLIEMY